MVREFFFYVIKIQWRGGLPSPLLSRACECGWIYINIPESVCLWKCLNKIFWLCQSSTCLTDLKMPQVLNVQAFWICMVVYARVLNMSKYDSIYLNVPQYACLIMTEYCWMSLTMPENERINCSDYARVFNMPFHLRYLTGFSICCRH